VLPPDNHLGFYSIDVSERGNDTSLKQQSMAEADPLFNH
jgi:hypothetical protein